MAQKLGRFALDVENFCRLDGRSWYLKLDLYFAANALYYDHALNIISDGAYDNLVKHLADNFDTARSNLIHGYEEYFTLSSLKAGTGYASRPPMINQIASDAYLVMEALRAPQN